MNQINELAAFLKEHDRYVVIGHINPDGDAVGCAVSAALALKEIGKEAFVFLPGGMPVRFKGFKCSVQIVSAEEDIPFMPATAFTVDISAEDRMGSGMELFRKCTAHCALDHHATNPGIGEVCVVDGNAAACGELVKQLYDELDLNMSAEAAQWLFIAVCTDSGRFGFSNTRGETLDTAAACVRAGADVDEITSVLYRTRTVGHTRLLGDVLHHLQMNETGELCWSYITDEMFEKAGAIREDNEGIVNYLVEMEGVEFACLAEQRGDKVKLSLRSHGRVNVGQDVAVPLGGGGHACAAGASVDATIEEAIAQALDLASAALKNS